MDAIRARRLPVLPTVVDYWFEEGTPLIEARARAHCSGIRYPACEVGEGEEEENKPHKRWINNSLRRASPREKIVTAREQRSTTAQLLKGHRQERHSACI